MWLTCATGCRFRANRLTASSPLRVSSTWRIRLLFLREVHRVLKPEGLLLLTTPNTVSVRSRVRFFGSGFFHQDPRPLCEARRDPMHHVALQTLSELRYG